MGEVAELHFLPLEEPDGEEEDEETEEKGIEFEEETLDPSPYWPSASDCDLFVPVFASDRIRNPRSDPLGSDYLDEDQVTLSLDLFDRCPPPETLDSNDFRVLDGIEDMESDYLGLGLELGLASGFDEEQEEELDRNREIGSDWGPDGFLDGDGLRIVGFESDSESEEGYGIGAMSPDSDTINSQDVVELPLCWDCLRLEDNGRDPDDGFEWEEVESRLDEREVLSMMVGASSDGERSSRRGEDNDDDEEVDGNVEWEVLLAVNNLTGRDVDLDLPSMNLEAVEDAISDLGDEFINPSEYEILFGQFVDHESAIRGSPPAAKLVVESLPSVLLTEEDVAKNNTLCAVCKDEIRLEERAKRLPCSHHYHGECILPWLGIRNTCPVCRFELPTDDPEYESWRVRRRTDEGGSGGRGDGMMEELGQVWF